jgi:hypothetical protein
MALIVDPDNLTQDTEVTIDTTAKTITLTKTGNLSDDGVTLQCLYSFFKEEWKADVDLIKFPFPMITITEEKFEMVNGWDFADTTTKQLVRTGGWALKNDSGVSLEEYAGIITLGSIGGSDQVYYQQVAAGAASNIVLTGAVNQAVKVYGDGSHGAIDYRSYFKIFVREYQKLYAQAELSDIGVTTMTYQVYRFPLANSADTKITHPDGSMAISPYSGMSITWYAIAQQRSIGGTNRDFHVIIDGNSGTAEQIYEFVQYSLRQNADIDDGTAVQTGKVTNSLLQFVGDTLKTRSMPEGGVFIDNYLTSDINRLVFVDDLGVERVFPYVATLILQFGDNLVNDAAAIYKVFFTNDDLGDNLGYDYGTENAIVVNDADATAMSGDVDGNASIQLSYDYDKNDQRGSDSTATDAPITVVAIGLSTAQYVKATGTIQRSTSNTVSLVAALERNYSNPV